MQRRYTTTASAAELGRLLCAGAGEPHDDRLRMCIGWYSEIEQIADLDVATALVVERPPTTGDPRFDALLAGLRDAPAALARRCVFLDRRDLQRV